MNIIFHCLRIILGLIFIVSGFVKAIDPKGLAIKLEEYFSPKVFDLEFLNHGNVVYAVLLILMELILGFRILFSHKLKSSLYGVLALCLLFGFLTFYSAYYNVVTDCGCFGDALKLTPWQSFGKDIILLIIDLILMAWLARRNKAEQNDAYYQAPKPSFVKGLLVNLPMLVCAYFMYHGIVHEPLVDFRSYKIGTDIKAEQAKIKANPSVYSTFYHLKNSKTKAEMDINQEAYMTKEIWKDSLWVIDDSKTSSKLISEGYQSAINKFHILDASGNEITQQIIDAPSAIVLFAHHSKDLDAATLAKYEGLMKQQKVQLIMGVASEQKVFKQLTPAFMDLSAIETIARSNPFVVIFEHGKIIHKQGAKDYFGQ
jgi:hypothetical protein